MLRVTLLWVLEFREASKIALLSFLDRPLDFGLRVSSQVGDPSRRALCYMPKDSTA